MSMVISLRKSTPAAGEAPAAVEKNSLDGSAVRGRADDLLKEVLGP
ncbi:MAG: hypothetical protein JRH20_05810 [Deltaproteobacteria bacterium]|nr:hypothetical protein [Deltaproteobacteria bacterium]